MCNPVNKGSVLAEFLTVVDGIGHDHKWLSLKSRKGFTNQEMVADWRFLIICLSEAQSDWAFHKAFESPEKF